MENSSPLLLSYHQQQSIQALQPADYCACIEFSDWIIPNGQLIPPHLLFTNKVMLTRNRMMNQSHSYSWAFENPNARNVINFQHKFSVNICCRISDDRLIGPHASEHHLATEKYLNVTDDHHARTVGRCAAWGQTRCVVTRWCTSALCVRCEVCKRIYKPTV